MKSIRVVFTTNSDQRAILGACWARGLDPECEDDDEIRDHLVQMAREEITRRQNQPAPPKTE